MEVLILKSRLVEIDAIRGITIFLVVAGHTALPVWLNDILRTFRMPLFFMVSGYLFSSRKYLNNTGTLIRHRFWSLLVPYFSAGMLFFLLWIILIILKPTNEYIWYKPFIGVFYGNGAGGWLGLNGPLWFLVCLFSAQVIYCVTLSFVNKFSMTIKLFAFILIGGTGVLISRFIFLPWSFDVAMVAVLFMFVGGLIKENKVLEKLKLVSGVSIITLVIFFGAVYFNSWVDMDTRTYGNLLLFYAAGIAGSLLVMTATKTIVKSNLISKVLSFLGKESLVILIFHVGLCFPILRIIDGRFFNSTLHWMIYLIFGIVTSLFIGYVIKKVPILNTLLNGKKLTATSQ